MPELDDPQKGHQQQEYAEAWACPVHVLHKTRFVALAIDVQQNLLGHLGCNFTSAVTGNPLGSMAIASCTTSHTVATTATGRDHLKTLTDISVLVHLMEALQLLTSSGWGLLLPICLCLSALGGAP